MAISDNDQQLQQNFDMTISNPVPSAPSNISVVGGLFAIDIEYDKPTDNDWIGTIIALSSTNPPNTTTERVAKAPGNKFSIALDSNGAALLSDTDYYVKIASYDEFGETGITFSDVYTVRLTQLPTGYYNTTGSFTVSGATVTIPEITSASLATKAKGAYTTDSWASDTVTGLIQTALDMDSANAWDSEDGTDYSTAANRASSTFYMHFVGNDRHVPYSVSVPIRRETGGAWNMFAPLGPVGEAVTTYAEFKTYIEGLWSGTTVTSIYILDDNNAAGFPAISDPEFLDVTASTDSVNYGKGMWVKLTGTNGNTDVSLAGYTSPVEWEVFTEWSLSTMPVGVQYLGLTDQIDDFEATLPFDVDSLWWWNEQDNAWNSWTKGAPEFLNTLDTIEAGIAYYFGCHGNFDTEQKYVINHPELRHVFSPNETTLQTRLTSSSFSSSNISLDLYNTNTVDVTTSSAVIDGNSTSFLSNVSAGDSFKVNADGTWYTVLSVDSDIQLTLTEAYTGGNGIAEAYTSYGKTVTITDTDHGAMTEDKVEITGFTIAPDSSFNTIHSITRIDDNDFTIVLAKAPTSAISGTGTIKHSHSDSVRVAKITTDASGDIETITTYRSGI